MQQEIGSSDSSNKFLFSSFIDDQKTVRRFIKNKMMNISDEEIHKLDSQHNRVRVNLQTNVKNLYDHIQSRYIQRGEVPLNVLMKKTKTYAHKFNVNP